MKIELKKTTDLGRELKIEIDKETVDSALEKKFMEFSRTADLKGFRKGKVPMDMIKNIYNDKARLDVADDLIKDSYPKAVQEKTLKVATRPSVTELDYNDDGGFFYTAKVEVFPEIESVVFENLEIKKIATEVTDTEVDETLEHILDQASELRTVTRPIEKTDVVTVDMEKTSDTKNAIAETSFLGTQIDLGNKMTVKEFGENLPGLNVGDEKDIVVKYDEDYSDPKFAGAEITYHCVIKEIKEKIKPEFTDAFVKSTGQAETALEFKLKIRERINAQKQEDQTRTYRRELIQQVCEKNEIPVPDGLVDEYLDSVIEDLKKQPNEKFDEKEIRKNYRSVGVNSMRWNMLWNHLSQQEKIEVLPSDTEKWINGFAAANNMTPDQAQTMLRQSGRANSLKDSLLEEKVLDFLMEKAKTVSQEK